MSSEKKHISGLANLSARVIIKTNGISNTAAIAHAAPTSAEVPPTAKIRFGWNTSVSRIP